MIPGERPGGTAGGTAIRAGTVRPAAVAGTFYPGAPDALARMVDDCLAGARDWGLAPKALIAPHAGFVYSGPVAGSAYRQLTARAHAIDRVVLLGPPHRVPVRKFAVPTVAAFETPLGRVPLDAAGIAAALAVPGVEALDAPHAREHSLETHLPFLQRALGDFALVPVVVGGAGRRETDALLRALWGGPETLVVVSSDLSHYLDYDAARAMDQGVRRLIETLKPDGIGDDQACGRHSVKGLLTRARALDLRVTTLDMRSSGDTPGRAQRERVVGYGAWALEYAAAARLREADRAVLLDAARRSIANGLRAGEPARVALGTFPAPLETVRASFVTLTLDGTLRGCIGSLVPHRPLIEDVAANACKAAFGDPRFAPLSEAEAARIAVSVSILSHPRPLSAASEAEAADALEPDLDGAILQAPGPDGRPRRGVFLPRVWRTVPEPARFLAHLKAKAGLAPDHWSDDTRLWRFRAETFH